MKGQGKDELSVQSYVALCEQAEASTNFIGALFLIFCWVLGSRGATVGGLRLSCFGWNNDHLTTTIECEKQDQSGTSG